MVRFRAVALGLESDAFPRRIEFSVCDASGNSHLFVEKVPVVTLVDFREDSPYPVEFWIEAEAVVSTDEGVVISLPWGLETSEGHTQLSMCPVDIEQA